MAEKIRSLVQRFYTAPWDIYDIWTLRHVFGEKDWEHIREAFLGKMNFKGYQYTGADQLLSQTNIQKIRQAWNRSLVPQLKLSELPDFDRIINELIVLLKKYLD